jgi:hypothetical protein
MKGVGRGKGGKSSTWAGRPQAEGRAGPTRLLPPALARAVHGHGRVPSAGRMAAALRRRARCVRPRAPCVRKCRPTQDACGLTLRTARMRAPRRPQPRTGVRPRPVAGQRLPLLTPFELSKVLWALAVLRLEPPHRWLAAWLAASEPQLGRTRTQLITQARGARGGGGGSWGSEQRGPGRVMRACAGAADPACTHAHFPLPIPFNVWPSHHPVPSAPAGDTLPSQRACPECCTQARPARRRCGRCRRCAGTRAAARGSAPCRPPSGRPPGTREAGAAGAGEARPVGSAPAGVPPPSVTRRGP